MNTKKALVRVVLICLFVFNFAGSGKNVFSQELSGPENVYEFMWKTFDANYALFKAKHIDWQALYNIYRPLVNSKTTDDELFSIISKTLGHLNDNHVRLISENPDRFYASGYSFEYYGPDRRDTLRAIMRKRPVPEKYFKEPLKISENKIFAYGWLNDETGYFHFNAFTDDEGSEKAIDEIIAEFRNAKAIIIDVRRNGGGSDLIGKMIASRFADRKRLYMTTQERNGPKHDDFDAKKYFFVEPKGPEQFTKTVILLTSRLSFSAAENFALAMRILPHVTVAGDLTSGCFADNYWVLLPNGWRATYSKNYFLDYNGMCWEGIGVPPDIKMKDNYDSSVPANDLILETAVSLIRNGNLGLQDENEGLKPTESLIQLFAADMEKYGMEEAEAKLKDRYIHNADGNYYIDSDKLNSLAVNLIKNGKINEAGKLTLLAGMFFPEQADIYEYTGFEFIRQYRVTEAVEMLNKAVSIRQKKSPPLSRQFSGYLYDVLILSLLENGYDGMSKTYPELKDKYPLQTGEIFLNSLGYTLMH
ncbi:MAG: S41 family peptidase, partial [Ignavibacteria bacterium]|nr:S41 family peptidase [Ignavibacteria bacterium]